MADSLDAKASRGVFRRGIDFERLAYKLFGLGAREASEEDDPVWELRANLLRRPDLDAAPLQRVDVEGVAGAFLVPGLLSTEECTDLLGLGETLGFTGGSDVVDVPTEIRRNDVCVVLAPSALTAELSRRLAPLVPRAGTKGSQLCTSDFVNSRLRFYRYAAGDGSCSGDGSAQPQRFGPHYDGAQAPSAAAEGRLVEDRSDGTCLSQLSVLMYLTGGHAGGETVFYPGGDASDRASEVRVSPERGAALCFWHGRHPLSPLHEGAALTAPGEPKYVIRTDILYCSEKPPVTSNEWESSNTVNAMLRAMQVMSG